MVDNDRIHYGINIFSLSEQSLVSRLAASEQVVNIDIIRSRLRVPREKRVIPANSNRRRIVRDSQI